MRRATLGVMLALLFPLVVTRPAEGRRSEAKGMFRLKSMTDGAVVAIDGREVGTIPLPGAIPLNVGKHTLRMTKQGYTEYLDVFTVERGVATELDIDLLPYAGILVITSSVKDARIYVDGKFEGVAPLEREVLIGKRSVKVTKAGYYDFMTTLASAAGSTRRVHAKLVPLPIGSTPYRPPPPPPPKWYEKWYFWVGAAGGVAAVALAIVLPVTLTRGDPISDWGPEKSFAAGK
jgi:hypothetical protein